jgi:hypothetical protein
MKKLLFLVGLIALIIAHLAEELSHRFVAWLTTA